jgi:hypothetical protein
MVEFSAGAVMGMLAIVEATVLALFLHLHETTASEDRVDKVESKATEAIKKARGAEREAARAYQQVERE